MTDAFDQAMNASWSPITTNFGQVAIDVWSCALIKGQGKVPFDPSVHSPDRKFTAIKISMNVVKNDGTAFDLTRETIAESKEWVQITLPSLKVLKVDLRGLNGRWCQVQLVPNGRKWTNDAGEEKEGTAFKFVKIFANQGECEAAKAAFRGQTEEDPGALATNGSASSPTHSLAPDPARATAAKFLPAYWNQAGQDLSKFEAIIRSTPILAKHFDLTSPEVQALIPV